MVSLSEQIEAVLPQTQCQQCGFKGCTPYAQALSEGETALNLCTPGGEAVLQDLAHLLKSPILPLLPAAQQNTKSIAVIDEQECIGCTACIKVCPVDAIMGSTKYMHTILTNECTGCELCLPSCPVDCIAMQPVTDAWLPRARTLVDAAIAADNTRAAAASQARQRYQQRQMRLQRLADARQQQLKQKIAASRQSSNQTMPSSAAISTINPQALIAKAMSRAQSQQHQRQVPENQNAFIQQQIEKAKQKAAYRRAERDLQYGNPSEKEAALQWLRAYKTSQEEKPKSIID